MHFSFRNEMVMFLLMCLCYNIILDLNSMQSILLRGTRNGWLFLNPQQSRAFQTDRLHLFFPNNTGDLTLLLSRENTWKIAAYLPTVAKTISPRA